MKRKLGYPKPGKRGGSKQGKEPEKQRTEIAHRNVRGGGGHGPLGNEKKKSF